MSFFIPSVTPDARPWRADWFGEVAYQFNGQRRSQPVYRVLISPVIGDPSSPDIVTDEGGQRDAWLPIGTLPMVSVGDIWQNGERFVQPDYQQESFDVNIANSWADIIKAGLSVGDDFLLPLSEHRWHRGATQSYCVCLSLKDGKRLIVPCMELIRFYFGSSSNLLHRLFTGPLREEMLWREKSFDPATKHLHINLANRISGASASDIGRIALSKEAWRSAAGICASCINATSQKRTAYPYTGFPFTGKSTLQVSGQWLSFAGVPDSTFVVYRINSCSHRFPFETLSYEVDAQNFHRNAQNPSGAGGGNNSGVWTRKSDASRQSVSDRDPDIKKRAAASRLFGAAKFPDLSRKAIWLEKIDTKGTSGVFMKHADGSVEQVAFGEGQDGGVGRETDIVQSGADRGYEPDKFKLPSFVTKAIKTAMDRLQKAKCKIPVFAKVMLVPGYSEPAFPLPRLVDEDGVIDPVTSCSNADKVIRQRRACFLRFEYESGDLIQFAVVIEAQKISEPPKIAIVRRVELAEVVKVLLT